MRNNLPVTNVEYVLKDAETVVSKADLKGRITYVNQDFINISGFSEEELLGAPQNIVRHPDMPAEAFEDFWRTIKGGKAWTGLVKNRCKNGDHYWVEAKAAPMLEKGRIVGYTSIRIKPTRQQVAAAEEAYRAIKAGGNKLEVREGNVVKRSSLARLNVLGSLPIKTKVMLASLTLTLLLGIAALFAWLDMTGTVEGIERWTIAVAILGMAVTASCGFLLIRHVVASMERATRDIQQMSSGDLTGRIIATGGDELGRLMQSLRILQTNVKLLVGQIKEATGVVNQGAAEIAGGNADLSSRTEAQASALTRLVAEFTLTRGADNRGTPHLPALQQSGGSPRLVGSRASDAGTRPARRERAVVGE